MSLATCATCHGRYNANIGSTCPFCGASRSPQEELSARDHQAVVSERDTGIHDGLPAGTADDVEDYGLEPSIEEVENYEDVAELEDGDNDSSDHARLDEFLSAPQECPEPEQQLPGSRSFVSLLFSPVGRIGRRDYLFGFFLLVCTLAMSFLLEASTSPIGSEDIQPVTIACLVTVLISSWMLALKRVHDFDNSAGFLVMMSLFLGAVPLFFFSFTGGSRGRNRYGWPTTMEWNFMSCFLAMILALGGVYSTLVMGWLFHVEQTYQEAYAVYSGGRNQMAQEQLQAVFEDADSGRSICPVCDAFSGYKMWSAHCLGDIQSQQQEWASAVEWLNKSQQEAETLTRSFCFPDIEASLLDIRTMLVTALMESGDAAQASALLEKMNEQLRNSPQLSGRAAELKGTEALLRLRLEEFDRALEIYTPLIEQTKSQLESDASNQELRSELGGYFHNRAIARSSLGDINGAFADLREAIQLQELALGQKPENPHFSQFSGKHHSFIGSLYYHTGEQDRALEAFEKAVQADPFNSEYRQQLAAVRMERLEFDRAADVLSTFLVDASDVHLEYMLAVSLLRQDLRGEASNVVDRMWSRHPTEVQSLFLTGVISMMDEDYSDASAALQKALEQSPTDPAILYNLAICQMKSGQSAEAEYTILRLQDVDQGRAAMLRQEMQSKTSDRPPLPVLFELQAL